MLKRRVRSPQASDMRKSNTGFGDLAAWCGVAAWRVVAAVAGASAGCSATAHAANDSAAPAPQPAPPSFAEARSALTDPGGLRTRLLQAGLKFTFTYYGDA